MLHSVETISQVTLKNTLGIHHAHFVCYWLYQNGSGKCFILDVLSRPTPDAKVYCLFLLFVKYRQKCFFFLLLFRPSVDTCTTYLEKHAISSQIRHQYSILISWEWKIKITVRDSHVGKETKRPNFLNFWTIHLFSLFFCRNKNCLFDGFK